MKPEPCPKCRDDEPFTETVVGRWWAAECSKCRYSSATYPTEAEAVEAWNTRAAPATDEALVEVATFLKGVPVGDFPGDNYNDKLASAQRMIAAIAAMQALSKRVETLEAESVKWRQRAADRHYEADRYAKRAWAAEEAARRILALKEQQP